MPRLPILLSLANRSIEVTGLLDTGATVNVLPYQAGLALGAVWEDQNVPVVLSGNLGRVEARALILAASHPEITGTRGVRLAFAWTRAENVPVIFGQMNFFLAFDVCFFRSQGIFDVSLTS